MKINEYQLKEKINTFDNKNIVVYFNDLLQAKIIMNNVKINYNIRTGYLKIKDDIDNNICINIVSAYNIQAKERKIIIELDSGINVKIQQN